MLFEKNTLSRRQVKSQCHLTEELVAGSVRFFFKQKRELLNRFGDLVT